jgi:hypothetical protein
MHQRIRGPRALAALLGVCAASVAIVACGSSSSSSQDPAGLLKDTFAGTHKINSGNIDLTLTVDPSGSSTLSGPIKLSFGGPFQSDASGKLPQSDFDVNLSALGKSESLGILSTGSKGYITLQGTSYQLPAATFKKLQSSVSPFGATGTGSGNSSTLDKLGIKPLDWLKNPAVVGTESIAGTDTTHIRAGVDVPAFLTDIDTFLRKASAVGLPERAGISNGLAASTRAKIAREVRNATFDVWTGKDDKTLRKLAIGVTLPVTGQTSTQLGGMHSAAIGLTIQYADLNQPQAIAAPKSVRPYSEFTSKVHSLVQSLQGATGSSAGGSAGGSGSGSGSSSGLAGASTGVKSYSRCVTAAGGDVAKMQRCAPLLNGG